MDTDDFKCEIIKWAGEIGVVPKEVHVRHMNRKWASCSSKGRLTFATDLMRQPKDVRTKAILHELLHLKYPNHGKMFTTLLNLYMSRAELK